MVVSNYYVYKPLPSHCIRLLNLIPNKKNPESFEISLFVADLRQNPSYNSISYTWDQPTVEIDETKVVFTKESRCYPILCDGKIILATENLRNALRCIAVLSSQKRKAGRDLTLPIWVDAICINQSDIAERNAQVAIMADIYRQCKLCIAFLGDTDRHSENALRMLRRIAALEAGDSSVQITQPVVHNTMNGGYLPMVVPGFGRNDWIDYYAFSKRRWFTRTWVCQEIALSSDVLFLCGLSGLEFSELLLAFSHLIGNQLGGNQLGALQRIFRAYVRSRPSMKPYLALCDLENMDEHMRILSLDQFRNMFLRREVPSFVDAVRVSFGTQCSDPRDKIFGLIGMSAELSVANQKMIPNYNDSVERICFTAWLLTMRMRKDLRVLSIFQDPKAVNKGQGLPSFCPDLNEPLNPRPFHQYDAPLDCTASRGIAWKCETPSSEPFLLILNGVKLSRICEVSTFLDSWRFAEPLSDCDPFLLLSHIDPYNSILKRTKCSRAEAFWRTVTLDGLYRNDMTRDEAVDYATSYVQLMSVSERPSLDYTDSEANSMPWQKQEDVTLRKDRFEIAERAVRALLREEPKSASILPCFAEMHNFLRNDQDVTFKEGLYRIRFNLGFMARMNGVSGPSSSKIDTDGRTMIFVNRSAGRKLFRTDGDHLGKGTPSHQVGDELWLLGGGPTPYILRPLPNGNYQFMGEAYVFGCMNGEAVPDDPYIQEVTLQ